MDGSAFPTFDTFLQQFREVFEHWWEECWWPTANSLARKKVRCRVCFIFPNPRGSDGLGGGHTKTLVQERFESGVTVGIDLSRRGEELELIHWVSHPDRQSDLFSTLHSDLAPFHVRNYHHGRTHAIGNITAEERERQHAESTMPLLRSSWTISCPARPSTGS